MPDVWPLLPSIIALAAGALVIGLGGPRLVRLADRLADQTGLGEALFGALILGAITSLAGVTTSVTAALDGLPALSFSNAIGGIAAQTLFLVFADVAYRRANLEHAAASLANLVSATLLIVLLAVALGAAFAPNVTLAGIHPASLILFAAYLVGLRLIRQARTEPMWQARSSDETRPDTPDRDAESVSLGRSVLELALLGAVVVAAGWAVARGGAGIALQTGLTETAVGAVFTGVSTSLPELVTTIAAIRMGALVLAVGGIVGGNAFDVLFLGFADIAYRAGSLYHAVGPDQLLVLVMAMMMTAVLMLGLLSRQKRGPANVGAEGWVIGLLYVGTMAMVAFE